MTSLRMLRILHSPRLICTTNKLGLQSPGSISRSRSLLLGMRKTLTGRGRLEPS